MDWLVVRSQAEPGAARFTDIQNFDDDYQLKKGIPLKDSVPADMAVRMRTDFPNDIELVDSLYTPSGHLIVNDKVCRLFEGAEVGGIELLPIKVFNHKKKPVKDPYFVINILAHVDCIDVGNSVGVTWNSIDPTMIDAIQKMVLDPTRLLPHHPMGELGGNLKILRPTTMRYITLIHRGLAEQLQAQKLRGFSFTEIDEFSE